jgi:hypothetical protein
VRRQHDLAHPARAELDRRRGLDGPVGQAVDEAVPSARRLHVALQPAGPAGLGQRPPVGELDPGVGQAGYVADGVQGLGGAGAVARSGRVG